MRKSKIVFNLDDIIKFKVGGHYLTGRISAISDYYYIHVEGFSDLFICEYGDMSLIK